MKTNFRLPIKARYFLYTLLVVVIFTSCDNSPILDNTNILVITAIEKNNYTHNKTKYKVDGILTKATFTRNDGKTQEGFGFWFYGLDGEFKVGDTIMLIPNNR